MQKYYIASAASAEELAQLVNKMLENGWRIQGGVAVVSTFANIVRFYQAMISG